MRGKKIMDVGSDFGVDSITSAQHGARVNLVDLVQTNVKFRNVFGGSWT